MFFGSCLEPAAASVQGKRRDRTQGAVAAAAVIWDRPRTRAPRLCLSSVSAVTLFVRLSTCCLMGEEGAAVHPLKFTVQGPCVNRMHQLEEVVFKCSAGTPAAMLSRHRVGTFVQDSPRPMCSTLSKYVGQSGRPKQEHCMHSHQKPSDLAPRKAAAAAAPPP